MQLVFIHGAAAAGKLTVAKKLAQLTGLRLFHNHLTVDLVSSLFEFGTQPFITLREKIWLAAFAECARSKVSLIFTFNPERTVNTDFVQKATDVVKQNNGRVVFVELTCAAEEIERRIEAPSRKKFGKLGSLEQYRTLKSAGAFQFPALPADISIDTTDRKPFESAQMIRDYLAGQTSA
ncbi:MAG TPA: hypothetical protein VJT50_05760 [Pyrinomonadaceae bacterium]|nr:hypothetical protein [Pyrinomonadaceae bacterium]